MFKVFLMQLVIRFGEESWHLLMNLNDKTKFLIKTFFSAKGSVKETFNANLPLLCHVNLNDKTKSLIKKSFSAKDRVKETFNASALHYQVCL